MRIADYCFVALKDIRRQPTRSLLTVAALTISTAVLVSMLAVSIGGQQAISRQFGTDNALLQIMVMPNQNGNALSPYGTVQEVSSGMGKLSDLAVKKLLEIPHVTSASPRVGIWELHRFSVEGSEKQFVAQAQGTPYNAPVSVTAGESFASHYSKNEVILGESYARELGIPAEELLGKTISIVTQKGYRGMDAVIPAANASKQAVEAFSAQETILTARVVGVADGADQNTLLLPLGWTREIRTAQYNEATGVKKVDQLEADGYSAVWITADTPENVSSVSAAVKQLGYGQVSTKEQVQRFEQFTTIMWMILGAVALVAVVAAALGVANTMLMVASEQGYSIAVWRAVGARKSVIMRLFLAQALLLGVIGGVLGTCVGVLLSSLINVRIVTLLATQGVTTASIAQLPWWLLTGSVLLTSLFAVLAGVYPAYKAAGADPSAALRSN